MTNAYNPGSQFKLSSSYDKRIDPMTGIPGKFHSGLDFSALAGTPIPAAASGKVVYFGYNKNLGNVVIVKNDAGGYSLYGHMLDGNQIGLGQRIWQGDTIGLVGSTGERTKGNHLHYSVITDEAGAKITGTSKDGSIGISLNKKNTINPAEYDNYDPTPRYLDETTRAAQIMSGRDANSTSGALTPNHQDSFSDRFGKWGSSPAGITPLAATDRPASFNNRFGNWGSVPAGGFGNPGSPVLRWLQNYKRSEAPDGSSSASAQGAPPATPALQPNWPSKGSALGDQLKIAAGGPRPDTYPRLQSRRVRSAFPGSTPLGPSQPVSPPERTPLLGIFSGKPMSREPLPPQVFGLPDHSATASNGDWFNFLTGNASQSRTQPAPSPHPAAFDTGAPAVPFVPPNALLAPGREDSFDGDAASSSSGDSGVALSSPMLPPQQSMNSTLMHYIQYLNGLDGKNSRGASSAPLAPSDDSNLSGGVLGRIAALAGIAPQNPTQLAPPPVDNQLRGFYRDDPVQSWFIQRQR